MLGGVGGEQGRRRLLPIRDLEAPDPLGFSAPAPHASRVVTSSRNPYSHPSMAPQGPQDEDAPTARLARPPSVLGPQWTTSLFPSTFPPPASVLTSQAPATQNRLPLPPPLLRTCAGAGPGGAASNLLVPHLAFLLTPRFPFRSQQGRRLLPEGLPDTRPGVRSSPGLPSPASPPSPH